VIQIDPPPPFGKGSHIIYKTFKLKFIAFRSYLNQGLNTGTVFTGFINTFALRSPSHFMMGPMSLLSPPSILKETQRNFSFHVRTYCLYLYIYLWFRLAIFKKNAFLTKYAFSEFWSPKMLIYSTTLSTSPHPSLPKTEKHKSKEGMSRDIFYL
jgi:hypothetical protein